MSFVCGVDLGGRRARLAFVKADGSEPPAVLRLEPPEVRPHVEVARWAARVTASMFQLPPGSETLAVWIEEPRGPHHRSVFQLSVMGGAILAGIPSDISVDFVTAGECRKLVGLPGNASKQMVMDWMRAEESDRLDFVNDEHDSDAYVVARAILCHGSRSVLGEGRKTA